MKNLWRVIFLFVLPGIVAGGCTVNAFFRLADSDAELLKILSGAAVLWCFSGWLAMMFFRRAGNISALYYPAAALMAAGFSLGIGISRLCGLNGWIEGVIGTVISGWATGCIVQAFCSPTYRLRERFYFISGVALAAFLWITAAARFRLPWMETCFFYCCELLLIAFLAASPLSCRGSRKRRWLWRGALAVIAVAAYVVTPVFSFRPWNPAPAEMPDSLWVKTSITPQGSRFTWMNPDGTTAIFTPGGRLTQVERTDADLSPALICAAALIDKNNPTVILSAPANSQIPQLLKKIQARLVKFYRMTEFVRYSKSYWQQILQDCENLWLPQKVKRPAADIFIVTALPENPYPPVLSNFLQKNCAVLHTNSLVVITAELMKNPVVFAFLHDRFKHCTVLPVPGGLWCFSDQPLAGIRQKLEKRLDDFVGRLDNEFNDLPPGLWNVLMSHWGDENQPQVKRPETAVVDWDGNRSIPQFWFYLIIVGLFLLWRTLRLFGERRNIMYSCWNSAESAFSAMGIYLLALGLLIIHCGVFALTAALLSLIFVLSFCKFSGGGVWGGLLGILLILPAAFGVQWGVCMLFPVMIQAAFLLGGTNSANSFTVPQKQMMSRWAWQGMLLAAIFMTAVWMLSIPLWAVCALFLAARLPGIWQTGNKRVY